MTTGSILVRNSLTNLILQTRYFLYVLPLASLIAVPIIIDATTNVHATMGGVRILWFFTWVEIVWLSLWVSKTVARMYILCRGVYRDAY